MLDDRVCPVCQVLLRDGTTVCVKCGRTVEPAKTNLEFIDWPRAIYARLVHRLGAIWAGVVAGVAFILLLGFFVFLVVIQMKPQ
jgi:hypothetical protein